MCCNFEENNNDNEIGYFLPSRTEGNMDYAIILECNYKIYPFVLNEFESVLKKCGIFT
jgi:hypothetical protein